MCHLRGSEIPWRSRLNLSEVTFNGILHWAYTCTALLRAALACLLAAVCEVYAGPVWASSATFYAAALAVFYGRTSLGIIDLCTALLRAALACLLAAVCEVYAGPVWASSATFYAACARHVLRTDLCSGPI